MGNLSLWSLCICVKQAQRSACRRAPERVLLFLARCEFVHMQLILHAVQGSTMEPERGDSKSETLIKQQAVTPHALLNGQGYSRRISEKAELRQHRTFRKWRHNLAIYHTNSHGSCVNSATSALKVGQLLLGNKSRSFLLDSHRLLVSPRPTIIDAGVTGYFDPRIFCRGSEIS